MSKNQTIPASRYQDPSAVLKISARVVIVNAAGCVLVLRRVSTSKHFAGQWEFPGGKTDEGEAVEQALLREVWEETGLVLRLGRVLGADEFSLPGKRIAVLFLEAVPTAGAMRLSEEHDAFHWVAPAELPSLDLAPPCRKIAHHYAVEAVRRTAQAPASKP